MPASFIFAGNKGSELRMTYKLTARMGQDITQTRNSDVSKVEKFLPLVNKRILIISNGPKKITHNLSVTKEH